MKCLECDHLKLITDETGYGEARCLHDSKKGKCITWAHTLLLPRKIGSQRVKEELLKKKRPPYWCKIKS